VNLAGGESKPTKTGKNCRKLDPAKPILHKLIKNLYFTNQDLFHKIYKELLIFHKSKGRGLWLRSCMLEISVTVHEKLPQ
jgi:hypothetical protein